MGEKLIIFWKIGAVVFQKTHARLTLLSESLGLHQALIPQKTTSTKRNAPLNLVFAMRFGIIF